MTKGDLQMFYSDETSVPENKEYKSWWEDSKVLYQNPVEDAKINK